MPRRRLDAFEQRRKNRCSSPSLSHPSTKTHFHAQSRSSSRSNSTVASRLPHYRIRAFALVRLQRRRRVVFRESNTTTPFEKSGEKTHKETHKKIEVFITTPLLLLLLLLLLLPCACSALSKGDDLTTRGRPPPKRRSSWSSSSSSSSSSSPSLQSRFYKSS